MRGATYTFQLGTFLAPKAVEILEWIPGVQARGAAVGASAPPTIRCPLHAGQLVYEVLVQWGLEHSVTQSLPTPLIEGNPAAATVEPENIPGLRPEALALLTGFQRKHLAFHQAMLGGMAVWACGSGKTFFGLLWALSTPGRVLVITRSATVPQWESELHRRFTDVRIHCLYGQSGFEVHKVEPASTWETVEEVTEKLTSKTVLRLVFSPDEIRSRLRSWGLPEVYDRFETHQRPTDRDLLLSLGLLIEEEQIHREEVRTQRKVRARRGQTRWRVWSEDGERYVAEYDAESEAIGDVSRRKNQLDIPEGTRILCAGWAVIAARRDALLAWGAPTLVVDESHRGKEPSRFQGIPLPDGRTEYRVKPNASGTAMLLGRRAVRVLQLSATPMPDRVRDIYAQADLYDPGGFGRKFRTFADRYCLSPETPVLLPTGLYRPLRNLVVGEEVVGWCHERHQRTLRPTRVLETFQQVGRRVRLHLESGKEFICTPDHEWLYYIGGDAENQYRRAVVERPRNNRPGLRLEPIKHLVRLTAPAQTWEVSDEYRLGYLIGLTDGDGTSRHSPPTKSYGETYSVVIRCKDLEHMQRGHEYGVVLGLNPRPLRRVYGDLWCLAFHNRRAHETLRERWPQEPSLEFWRGWISGIHDAEGWGLTISQYSGVNPVYYARIAQGLMALGLDFHSAHDSHKMRGGALGLLAFYDLVRPALTRKSVQWDTAHAQFKPKKDRVLRVEYLDEGPVACIRTELGNFVADGYGTHNCAGHENSYGHYDSRGASNIPELQARLDTFTSRVSKSEAHAALPPIGRQIITLPPKELLSLRGAGGKKSKVPTAAGGHAALAEARAQVAAEAKREYLAKRAVDYAVEDGFKVCVFTGRHASCETLGATIQKLLEGPNKKREARGESPIALWVSHGGIHAARERQALVEKEVYPHPGPSILVGTMDSFSEAINGLHDTDRAICGYLPWNLLLEQFEGRFSRLGSVRRCVIEYIVAEKTIDEGILDMILGKAAEVNAIMPSEVLQGIAQELSGENQKVQLLDSLLAKLIAADDDQTLGWMEEIERREAAIVPLAFTDDVETDPEAVTAEDSEDPDQM